ncbi:hypothetical protein ACIBXA_19735 [Micromonospora echinaurantiaca]|uniref:hypothetical protein n=1 Tax=Micromonospora echinaurantiaca TaxID=47857 RepID=UPI0037BDD696
MSETGTAAESGTASGVGCWGTGGSNRAAALRRIGMTRPPAPPGWVGGTEPPCPAPAVDGSTDSKSGGRLDGPWADAPEGGQLW